MVCLRSTAVRAALVAREAELSLLFDPVVKAARHRGGVELIDKLVKQAVDASTIQGGATSCSTTTCGNPAMVELDDDHRLKESCPEINGIYRMKMRTVWKKKRHP